MSHTIDNKVENIGTKEEKQNNYSKFKRFRNATFFAIGVGLLGLLNNYSIAADQKENTTNLTEQKQDCGKEEYLHYNKELKLWVLRKCNDLYIEDENGNQTQATFTLGIKEIGQFAIGIHYLVYFENHYGPQNQLYLKFFMQKTNDPNTRKEISSDTFMSLIGLGGLKFTPNYTPPKEEK